LGVGQFQTQAVQGLTQLGALADDLLGPDWATPARFRLGASGLLIRGGVNFGF
jgi:hypothetical protein